MKTHRTVPTFKVGDLVRILPSAWPDFYKGKYGPNQIWYTLNQICRVQEPFINDEQKQVPHIYFIESKVSAISDRNHPYIAAQLMLAVPRFVAVSGQYVAGPDRDGDWVYDVEVHVEDYNGGRKFDVKAAVIGFTNRNLTGGLFGNETVEDMLWATYGAEFHNEMKEVAGAYMKTHRGVYSRP